ncbi:MAG: glycosyltransferase [Rickettsiales bacterium]
MRVANIMLGRGKGGLEQCVVDYAEALADRCESVFSVVDPLSPYVVALGEIPGKTECLRQRGEWDIFAAMRLKKILRRIDADVIICHGNRAFRLARKAAKKRPVVFVTHNERLKSARRADAVFATNNAFFADAARMGFTPDENLFLIPNMVRAPMQKPRPRQYGKPIVIGFLGRLSRRKGAHILLEAAKILEETPGAPDFSLYIGGDGEEKERLQKLCRKLGLQRKTTFAGWIEDKPAFFRKIDIFCLPSVVEAFGIALVEAMGGGVPAVATDCLGPRDVIDHKRTGLLAPAGNARLLAETLEAMMKKTPEETAHMTEAAFTRAEDFNVPRVGHAIYAALKKIVNS